MIWFHWLGNWGNEQVIGYLQKEVRSSFWEGPVRPIPETLPQPLPPLKPPYWWAGRKSLYLICLPLIHLCQESCTLIWSTLTSPKALFSPDKNQTSAGLTGTLPLPGSRPLLQSSAPTTLQTLLFPKPCLSLSSPQGLCTGRSRPPFILPMFYYVFKTISTTLSPIQN